jgi:hypothetical protein
MTNITWAGAGTANDWSSAANHNPSGVPANGDTVILENFTENITAGLGQSAVTLAELDVARSWLGDLGDADNYFDISATKFQLGRLLGLATPTGSDRIKINFGANQTDAVIHYTPATSADTDKEPARFKGSHASNVFTILGGTVGLGTDDPDDACTCAELNIKNGLVNVGESAAIALLNMEGGSCRLRNGATTVVQSGGTLKTFGASGFTTITLKRGADMRNGDGGNIATVNLGDGANLVQASDALTITTLNAGAGVLDLSDMRGTVTVSTFNVLSNEFQLLDPFKRLATSTAFVMGDNVEIPPGLELGVGRTLTLTT